MSNERATVHHDTLGQSFPHPRESDKRVLLESDRLNFKACIHYAQRVHPVRVSLLSK